MKRWALMLGFAAVGCRTQIQAVAKDEPASQRARTGDGTCDTQDFPMAVDVPAGAKNLGWVKVRWQGDEEVTFAALRKKVCDMGGDALSQVHWLRPSGTSVAEPPHELEANAWALP